MLQRRCSIINPSHFRNAKLQAASKLTGMEVANTCAREDSLTAKSLLLQSVIAAQALQWTQLTEEPAWMELCPKPSPTSRDGSHGVCYIQCQHAFATHAYHLKLYKPFSHGTTIANATTLICFTGQDFMIQIHYGFVIGKKMEPKIAAWKKIGKT